jgi:glycosyltransferase involved in cell wall biosynthesis
MKFSVITINYNNCVGLRKTIESVVAQTFKDFEWIVIDGGSTDGSLKVIEQFASYMAYWVSEPDKGIYNAMNKGIKVATGEYLLFLNSGDWLASNAVLQEVSDASPTADFVYGNHIERDGSVEDGPYPLTFLRMYRSTICHQDIFHSKRLFVQRQYDESYKIVSDWKFLFEEIVRKGASVQKINVVVSALEDGNSYNVKLLPKERSVVLENLYSEMEREAIEEYLKMKESGWYQDLLFMEKHKLFFRLIKRIVRCYKKFCK